MPRIVNIRDLVHSDINNIVTHNVNVIAARDAITTANTLITSCQATAALATLSANESAANALLTAEDLTEVRALSAKTASDSEDALRYANEAWTHRDRAFDYLVLVNEKYDLFDDRYLGAYDTDPRWDNDDNSLIEGAIYWNMLSKKIRVFNGTAWMDLLSGGFLTAANNLSELTNITIARANLNVYSIPEVDALIANPIITGDRTFTGNVTIQGDLTVNGANTVINAATVQVEDNLLVLNNGEVGAGVTAGISGIEVDRGLATDYQFIFDEVTDTFVIGEIGALQPVATREDVPLDGGYAVWDALTHRFITVPMVPATDVSITPIPGIIGTTAQLAIEELQAKILQFITDIEWTTLTPTVIGGGLNNTDLQLALNELQGYMDMLIAESEW